MAVIAGMFIALGVSGDVYQRIVSVHGRPVAIGRSLRTVNDGLVAARQPLATGAVRAAMSGRVLVPDNDPARIAVNGRSASTMTPVQPGDEVWVTNGVDTTEPVVERQVIGSLPRLPAVETTLWRPDDDRSNAFASVS